MISSFNNQIQIIDLITEEEVKRFTGHKHSNYLIDLCFYCKEDHDGNNDNYFVVSGSEDGAIYSWNIEEKNAYQKYLHKPNPIDEEDEDIHMEPIGNKGTNISSASISSNIIKHSYDQDSVLNTMSMNTDGIVAYANCPDKSNSINLLYGCNMDISS